MIFDASSLYMLLKKRELERLRDSETLDLAFYEVGNAMLNDLRRRIITEESFKKATEVLNGISQLIKVEYFSGLDASNVSEIAKRSGLTFYDASYLNLALMTGQPLATNDGKLKAEADKLGIKTFSV